VHLIYALAGAVVAAALGWGLAQLSRRAETQAATDLSSGLFTLPSFLAMGERVLALTARRRSTCSMVVVRAVGEAREAALQIVKTIRGSDVVGRVGRDEIALLLPDTPAEGAKVLVDRLKSGGQIELVGMSQFPEFGQRCEALLEAARTGKAPVQVIEPEGKA
jgi:hypothetical protein